MRSGHILITFFFNLGSPEGVPRPLPAEGGDGATRKIRRAVRLLA
jgi:hypothetical protein